MTTFTDAGIVDLRFDRQGAEPVVVSLPIFELEEELVAVYKTWNRPEGEPSVSLVEGTPALKAVFDKHGVPQLTAGGYHNLAKWVHDQTNGQKKTEYYAENACSPSSTDSGPGS